MKEAQYQGQKALGRQHGEGHGAGLGKGALGGFEQSEQASGQRGEQDQPERAGSHMVFFHSGNSSPSFVILL